MMTKEEFLTKIWNYYLMLEKDFMNTFQYVEPSVENNSAYSKEYNKLLLSIGSEIDVVFKELCKKIENKNSSDVENYNITNYMNVISNYNNFSNENCTNLVTREIISPFTEWINSKTPLWWKNYNHLKHDRLSNDNIKLGNYLNVKESLSALYIICRFLYKTSYSKEPIPKSNLFQMNNWPVYTELGNGFLQVADEHGLSFYAN